MTAIPALLGPLLLAAAPAAAGPAAEVAAHEAGGFEPVARPTYRLPPLVIRADPLPDPLGPFPLASRVIGPASLARRPGGDLGDALLPVAGLRVTSRGTTGTGVSIRGATAQRVLVLVDGRRLDTAQDGVVDLDAWSLDAIERIEVFRGGASALWGSAALGGAIALHTASPSPGATAVRVGAGSSGERSLSARRGFSLGRSWVGRLSGRWLDSEGDYEYEDDRRGTIGRIENGDESRRDGAARVEGPLGSGWRLRFDGSGRTAERGVPGSEEFPTPTARLEDERRAIAVRLERGAPRRWQPAFELTASRSDRRYSEPEAAFGPVADAHRNVRLAAEARVARVADRVAVRLAAEVASDRLESTTDGSRRRDAAAIRARVTRDLRVGSRRVRLLGAARADAVDGFAPFLSPRGGVLAEIVPGRVSLRGSWGRSYRTPGFDELFWAPRASAAGNPDLRREIGRDVDAGIVLRSAGGLSRLELTAFRRTIDDLIQWVPGANGVWRPHNVGAARLSGVEAEATLETVALGSFRAGLDASGTYLRTEDRSGEPNADGLELPYRPRWTAAAGLTIARSGLGELDLAGRFVDDVWATRANTKVLEGRIVGDVRWRGRMGRGFSLDLALTNVGDASARDFRDYPLPGRAWGLGLLWERTVP
jgi:outer membrane cobalamin receptor